MVQIPLSNVSSRPATAPKQVFEKLLCTHRDHKKHHILEKGGFKCKNQGQERLCKEYIKTYLDPHLSNAISYALKEATEVDKIPTLFLACFKDEHGKGKSIEGSKSVINKCRRRLKNHRLVLITSIAAIVTDLINQVLKIMPHEDGVLSLLISLIKTRYPSNFMNTKDQIKTLTISYPTCKITSEPGTNTSKLSLLILGIEDSGKSTLLATLGGSKDPNCKPTLGFRPMSLRYSDKVTIKLNDLGGQKRIRGVWENYYHDSHGIIFVLDSSCSKEKFEETISVAKSALGHRFLQGKPLLVICNKKDRPETKSVEAVKEHIKCITQSDSQILVIKTSIHPKLSCTNNGRDKTINNAIEWIIECVLQQAQEIEERINRDKEEVDMFRRKRQAEKERKVLMTCIQKAFDSENRNSSEILKKDEAEEFLAQEIGLIGQESLSEEGKEVAKLVGYQRLALVIIGNMICPTNKLKASKSWVEVMSSVVLMRKELGILDS